MVRLDDSGDVTKCWLDRAELKRLEEAGGRKGWEREIALQLMGRCGFRADEVNYPGDAELRHSEEAGGWLVEVRGKNTKGGDPTVRDAWMPDDVEGNIRRFSRERKRATGEPWVQASTSTVRRWVTEAAEKVAQSAAQPERWREVSSHDLRRSWATHHLVERQVDVRTMMAVGGWSDYSAIEPYLAEPTEARIGAAMRGEVPKGPAPE
jgi:site-specific recombinase XerC